MGIFIYNTKQYLRNDHIIIYYIMVYAVSIIFQVMT